MGQRDRESWRREKEEKEKKEHSAEVRKILCWEWSFVSLVQL